MEVVAKPVRGDDEENLVFLAKENTEYFTLAAPANTH